MQSITSGLNFPMGKERCQKLLVYFNTCVKIGVIKNTEKCCNTVFNYKHWVMVVKIQVYYISYKTKIYEIHF